MDVQPSNLVNMNYPEAVLEEADRRRINRKTIKKRELLSALEDEKSNIFQISSRLVRLIYYRIKQKPFHPNAEQQVLNLSEKVFSVFRISIDRNERILAITNISENEVNLEVGLENLQTKGNNWVDILTKKNFNSSNEILNIKLDPL